MNFQITDAKPMIKNTLHGIFSLVIGPLKIEGFTYHVKNDKSWIGFPAKEYFDKETREKKYWPMIRIEDKVRYASFQKWCKGQVADIFKPKNDQGDQHADEIPF